MLNALELGCFTEYPHRNSFFFLVGDSSKSDIPVDDLWDLFVKVKRCIIFYFFLQNCEAMVLNHNYIYIHGR